MCLYLCEKCVLPGCVERQPCAQASTNDRLFFTNFGVSAWSLGEVDEGSRGGNTIVSLVRR